MKTRMKKSQVIALALALLMVCGQFAFASEVTLNPMEDDLGLPAYSEPPQGGGDAGSGGEGGEQGGGTSANFGSNIIIDPNNNTIQGQNQEGQTEITGLASGAEGGEGTEGLVQGTEEIVGLAGGVGTLPPGVSVIVDVEQVPGGFGNDDRVTIRGRIQDLGDGAGGPAILNGWSLQITFPEYLTAEQDIGEWLKDMKDRGFISAASGMSGNICNIYFTGGGNTAMLVSEFEWVMRVNLENYVGYTKDIVFTFDAGGSTYITSWEGPGIGGGLVEPGASKSIWSNVSNVNGINIIMDRTKPIGYAINVFSPALTDGTHYFKIEDVLNQRVVLCTPSGAEVSLANAVSAGAIIIDEKLSPGSYTISETDSGQGFKITVTGPGVAEGNYRFLYYVKLKDSTYQGVLTNGVKVDVFAQGTEWVKEDVVEMVTTKNSLLDIGKKVYDRNGTVSDRGLVMLNETTKEAKFQVVLRQIKDSVTQETGGAVLAEDILHAAFGTPVIGARSSTNGTNPFMLVVNGNRIQIVKDGTGYIKDGVYTLEFTVPINEAAFPPGKRVSNVIRSSEVFVHRSAQLKIDKTWLNPDGKTKGDVKFRLTLGGNDVLDAPVVLAEGQSSVTIYLDYLNDKIREGTYDYVLVEEVAADSDYASAVSQTISITKTTSATTGEVKFVTTGTGVHQVGFTNTPDDKEGTIRFSKYGKTGTAAAVPIGGGTFKLYKKSASGQFDTLVKVVATGAGVYEYTTLPGVQYETFTANANGVLINKLPYGEYKVFEQNAPDGYVMSVQWSDAKEVSKIYKDPTIRMDNTYFSAGKISIIKTDNATPTKNKLQGVQFKLEKDDGGIAAQTKSTNANGLVEFTNLPSGVYWLTELAYDGYTGYMSPNRVKVTITVDGQTVVGNVGLSGLVETSVTGKIITLNWINEQLFGKIIVKKVSLIGSQPLAGAIFELYKANSSGVIVGGVIQTSSATGTDGIIEFTGLAYGKYVVKEKEAPQGYTLDVNKQEVVTLNAASASLTWANETKKGTITLKKVGAGQYGNSPVAIGNVMFVLEDENQQVKTYTTNAQGTLTITGLEAGTYKLREQSLPSGSGYLMGTREETVVIGGAGNVWSYDFTSSAKWFVNDRILKQLKVLKTDENGVKMNGVTFKLNGKDLTNKTIPEQTAVTVDGVATFNDLPYGSYTLTEVSPAGYGAVTQTVEINANTTTPVIEISVQNLPYELIVKKVTDGGSGVVKKLTGAVFNLEIGGKYVQATSLGNGVYRYSGLTDSKAQATGFTTVGTEGQFRVTHIPAGSYVIREIEAPSGYVLLTDTQTVVISGAVTEAYVRTVSNSDIRGHLLIRKYKQYSENRALLPGVTFTITGPDNRSPITATTDTNGEIRIQNLLFGEYTIKEDPTTTPVGYKTEAVGNVFISKNGVTETVEVVNHPVVGEVEITKVDRIDGTTPLKDAVFALRPVAADGTIDDSATPIYAVSSAEGKAIFKKVPYGLYAIQETVPPKGYQEDTTIRYVVIGEGVTIPASLQDKIELSNKFIWDNTFIVGNLSIHKFDAKTRLALTGATFHLFRNSDGKGLILTGSGGLYDYSREAAAGEEPTLIETNAAGSADIRDLPYGMYTVQEVGAPEGYVLSSETSDAAIYGSAANVSIYNTPKVGRLRVLKVDAATDLPLLGAEVQVFRRDASGKPEGAMLFKTVTDLAGIGVITDIPLGAYVAVETVAPKGYELNSDRAVKPFDITAANADTLVELKYENDKSIYGLKIKKVDVDDETKVLAGAVFRVTNSQEFSKDVTTGDDGIATLDDLAKGTYKVKEIKAPTGYDLDPTEYSVEVNQHGAYVEVVAKNKLIIGKVRLLKQDENGDPLAGARFELYDGAGNKLRLKEIAANEYEVDASGTVESFLAGTAVIGNLLAGDYVFKEVSAPAGYAKLEEERAFTIDATNYNTEQIFTVTIKNVEYQAAVALIKVDESDQRIRLAGAEFQLSKLQSGSYVEVEKKTTDDSGTVVFNNLTMGSYRITETKAPLGYQLWKNNINFEVNENGKIKIGSNLYELEGGVFKATVTNAKILQQFAVRKVSSVTGEALAGATFRLSGSTGEMTLTTGSNGMSNTVTLPVGTYYLRETAAPTGYDLINSVYTVVVSQDGISVDGVPLTGTPFTITVRNTPSTAQALLYKTDSSSDDPLAGVVFTVTERGTNNVRTLQTGTNGQSNIIDLKAGSTYDIVETVAPTGYTRLLQGWTASVSASGQVSVAGSGIRAWSNANTVVINIENSKIPTGGGEDPPKDDPIPLGPGLPRTGELGGNMLLIGLIGVLLAGTTLFLFMLLGKKEEELAALPAMR